VRENLFREASVGRSIDPLTIDSQPMSTSAEMRPASLAKQHLLTCAMDRSQTLPRNKSLLLVFSK
jgi:hypothetical protein